MAKMINIDYGQRMSTLSSAQAAHRLGVKQATLYAYVSRGVLHSHRDPQTRQSRFDALEVERLATRGRPRQASRSASLDLQIDTHITEIRDHTIRYRGHDQAELARSATFEQVAELIWTGNLPSVTPTWRGTVVDLAAFGGEPNALRMSDRIRLIVAAAAVDATHRRDRASVVEAGSELVATLVDSLPIAGDGRCPRLMRPDGTAVRSSIAGRLWARLSPRRATPELLAVLNASLVLLADHEMAASTLAARVAASTRAGVHDVVTAGLGTLNGPLHGGESARVRRVLQQAGEDSVSGAISAALDHFGRLPGFGQVLYPRGDPRARLLLEMLRGAATGPALDLVERVVDEAARRKLPPPNVDLALGALGSVAQMPVDAGTALFASARIVGWLAHAMEEYDEPALRFRPRAVYVGD